MGGNRAHCGSVTAVLLLEPLMAVRPTPGLVYSYFSQTHLLSKHGLSFSVKHGMITYPLRLSWNKNFLCYITEDGFSDAFSQSGENSFMFILNEGRSQCKTNKQQKTNKQIVWKYLGHSFYLS